MPVVLKTPALDRFLEKHKPTCTYWIFSGDRHCSCGRDQAILELTQLRAASEQPMPIQQLVMEGVA